MSAVTWCETREMLDEDRRRLSDWLARDGLAFSRWHPAYLCVLLYRYSHYLHVREHKYAARLIWHLNGLVTGADIPPPIEIGPGFLIPCPAGTAIAGKAGRNFTVLMCSGIGGELGRYEDVGAGSGLPVLGDDVFMEPRTGVLGPVRVGNRVRIKAGATVTTNVDDDVVACAPPARFFPAAHSLRMVRR